MKKNKNNKVYIVFSLVLILTFLPLLNIYTVKASTMKLNKKYLLIGINESYQLKLLETKSTVKWNSSKPSIAKVNSSGTVTGLSEGSVKITATSNGKSYYCNVRVKFSKNNYKELMEKLKVEQVELRDNIAYVIYNNSNRNLNFCSELVFYDKDNKEVSLQSDGGRNILFKGDEILLLFAKPTKEYSYYKIRYKDYWGFYGYINEKSKITVTPTDKYDYEYSYYDKEASSYVKTNTQLFDLIVNNKSGRRLNVQAFVLYYKNNALVNIDDYTRSGYNLDIGITNMKNPNVSFIPTAPVDYDTFRISYSSYRYK